MVTPLAALGVQKPACCVSDGPVESSRRPLPRWSTRRAGLAGFDGPGRSQSTDKRAGPTPQAISLASQSQHARLPLGQCKVGIIPSGGPPLNRESRRNKQAHIPEVNNETEHQICT